jgi:hypothetical protein
MIDATLVGGPKDGCEVSTVARTRIFFHQLKPANEFSGHAFVKPGFATHCYSLRIVKGIAPRTDSGRYLFDYAGVVDG